MSLKKKARFLCAAAVLFSLAFTQSGVHGQVTDEGYAANTPWSGYWWPIKTGELLVPLGKYDHSLSDSVSPWTAARQAPLSTGFSRQEHWSGLSFPPSGQKNKG